MEFASPTEAGRRSPMNEADPKWLTTGEAAKLCSVKPDTVLKWIKRGRVQAVRTAGGHHRVRFRDIEPLVGVEDAGGACPPPPECTPRPLRCWEYLSDRGKVRETCQGCVVYRVRAAWCFEVRGLEEDLGHARLFCQTSCEECLYYRRVQGLTTNVLVISPDEDYIRQLEAEPGRNLTLRFARNAWEASAVVHEFRPDLAVVDRELVETDAGLLDCLIRDPRLPGLRVVLAVPPGAGRRGRTSLGEGIADVVEKQSGLDRITAILSTLPVEKMRQPGMAPFSSPVTTVVK